MLSARWKRVFVVFTLIANFISFSSSASSTFLQTISAKEDTQPNRIKICLTMIVKNESAIIERCLNAVKDHIDCLSICDTGSTDNTVQIIKQFMQTNNIPGEVHLHDWKNFGHNRTLSAQAAQETIYNLGFPLEDTYMLLLDADMLLVTLPDFDPNSLVNDAYLIMQKSSSMSYYNDRLLRASMPWKCVGVTHEYWSCELPEQRERINTLFIDDKEDGGCKADKFERDIRLLTEGLKNEPDNDRYVFYMAQSHRCLKNHTEALKWYKKRIERGGWKEEIWFSKYMMGECYEEMDDWEYALSHYLEAYNYLPERAEPLHNIASYYRKKGKNDLAYLFAKQGASIPFPEDQLLFISHPVYDYQFDEEIAITAYYTGAKEDGFASVNRLMLGKKVPPHIKDFAYQTALFYVSTLEDARFDPIIINLPKVREGFVETYNPMNPSIQKVDDGYMLLCRTVNYMQFGGGGHRSFDIFDPTIRTKNFLIHYNKDFKILSQQEIVDNLPRYRKKNSMIEGLEDCRLIKIKNEFWFTCSIYDLTSSGVPQIALCKLENSSRNKIDVLKLIHLKGPDPTRCEKNWLPFVKDNQLLSIYSYDPYIIYKPNSETGECREIKRHIPKHDFSAFRGSAPPIEFDDGYLMIVHEVIHADQRYYLHRFVYTDKNLNITKVSKPFTFLHFGIEYTCGMTIDHSETNLIIPIGIEDRNAYLCTLDLGIVRAMLEPLPSK